MRLPSSDPKRLGQFDTVIVCKLDGRAVTTVTIPKDTADKKEIEAAVTAELAKRNAVIGHTFQVK